MQIKLVILSICASLAAIGFAASSPQSSDSLIPDNDTNGVGLSIAGDTGVLQKRLSRRLLRRPWRRPRPRPKPRPAQDKAADAAPAAPAAPAAIAPTEAIEPAPLSLRSIHFFSMRH